MNCSEIKNNIIAYLEKDLPESYRISFREHLQECNNCMQLYNKVKLSWQVIDDEKQIIPDRFYFTRLEQAIQYPPQHAGKHVLPGIVRTVSAVAAVIVVLISIAGGILIGSHLAGEPVTDSYQNEYEYYSNLMHLNAYKSEPIESYLLSQEDE